MKTIRPAASRTSTSWWRCSVTCSASQVRGGCSCAGPYGHRLLDIVNPEFDRLRWFGLPDTCVTGSPSPLS